MLGSHPIRMLPLGLQVTTATLPSIQTMEPGVPIATRMEDEGQEEEEGEVAAEAEAVAEASTLVTAVEVSGEGSALMAWCGCKMYSFASATMYVLQAHVHSKLTLMLAA